MDQQACCPPATVWQQVLAGTGSEAPAGAWKHLEGCPRCQGVVDELTAGTRTWLDIATELRQPVASLPPVCQRALDESKHQTPLLPQRATSAGRAVLVAREASDDLLLTRSTMNPCIHLERMPHRNSIAVSGESAAGYTLLKLIPTGLGGTGRPPALNLALALDVSGSMYEEDGTGTSRLLRVQNAAISAIQKLRPEDTLAILAFAYNTRLLLPPTPLSEKGKIEDVIRRIDTFDVDPGGTAMDEGLALALNEIDKHAGSGKLSQIVLLTDGETSGEQNCRILAQKAAERKIQLALMGVGLDWKAALLKDLANLSQGKWYYIDASDSQEATRIFAEEFETLAATAFLNVALHLQPIKDVRIRRLRQVAPEIREVKLEETEERHLVGQLGTLQDTATRYILDLDLPKRPDGKYAVAQLELTYDLGTGQRVSSGPVPLEIHYTAAGHGHANAEVMKHIDEIRIQELSATLRDALSRNDQDTAVQAAQEIKEKAELLGPAAARKTKMVLAAVEEFTATRGLSRKTQLKLEDEARKGEVS